MSSWDLPRLVGIVEAPTIRKDGSVLNTPGFDPRTGLIYAPAPNLKVPLVPSDPTPQQVQAAVTIITDPVSEFPFNSDADHANFLATQMTPVIRPLIDGPVPACMLSSPSPGTGKSLLAEVIALTATGRPAAMMSPPSGIGGDSEEEWRKQITAKLRTSPAIIVIDNISRTIRSASLSRVLTAVVWSDRILGLSVVVDLPNHAQWLLTGNNISVGEDLPRRVFTVRIDAQIGQPQMRGGFKYPDLCAHVTKVRGNIIWGILVLTRAWLAAGRPVPEETPTLGNYRSWCQTLGGILANAEIKGFLGNIKQSYDEMDEDAGDWIRFFTWWYERHGDTPVTVRELVKNSKDSWKSELPDVLPDILVGEYAAFEKDLKNDFLGKLGRVLRDRRDKTWPGGVVLRRASRDRNNFAKWQVVRNA
jgi:hypothetical protein